MRRAKLKPLNFKSPLANLRISFACNDYRNGHFQGWFDQVNFGCYLPITLDGMRLTIKPLSGHRVRIGRRIFKHAGWAEWVGNWCWDELVIVDGAELLNYLRDRGFDCCEGPTKLFNAWKRKEKA